MAKRKAGGSEFLEAMQEAADILTGDAAPARVWHPPADPAGALASHHASAGAGHADDTTRMSSVPVGSNMRRFTMDGFWQKRLPAQSVTSATLVRGWSSVTAGLRTFKEAPLTNNTELTTSDPETSSIILVSAPGAVGKSTLAKEIAFRTNAVYVDLAIADPVGGNTTSGGLAKSGLYSDWEREATTLLIDGLDEARLRVTQEAFSAFLFDVADLSKGRLMPTVLFGRTNAVEDAWVLFSERHVGVTVLEIGYYGVEEAIDFAEAVLRSNRPDSSHMSIERMAITKLLERLRQQTESDGDRFGGYAPVLQAVAQRVEREGNPAALVAEIEQGQQPVTLVEVAQSIMVRERSKVATLTFNDEKLPGKLYSPSEQLDRLVARVYHHEPPGLPVMSTEDARTYSNALSTWVGDHPFINGTQGASAVFGAIITAHALKNSQTADAAAQAELRKGAAANPFLAEFYRPNESDGESAKLPPEHIGVVYASIRARLSLGDNANLSVDAREEYDDDEQSLLADVEINVQRRGFEEETTTLSFTTDQAGVIRLGQYIEDVELNVPLATVEIGPGPEAILIGPITVQCDKLLVSTEKLVVECPETLSNATVYLEAERYDGTQVTAVPLVRSNASLAVSWPGARSYPWISFVSSPPAIEDPRLEEALRRFRKFVIAFRSHKRGNLARYSYKIEHSRMTKGTGRSVLNKLLEERILSLQGKMYLLDADRLGERTGATYADSMARRFGEKTIEFIRRAVEAS